VVPGWDDEGMPCIHSSCLHLAACSLEIKGAPCLRDANVRLYM
jgi:hypothetical protein